MQTYSHTVITAALIKPARALADGRPNRWPRVRTGALLIGSFLPDLPLILMTVAAIALDIQSGVFRQIQNGPPSASGGSSLTMRLFDVYFFENPWVIAFHNLFHSPVLLALYLLIGYGLWRRGIRGGDWFFWLAAAAMFHTLLDIPLHTDDGPLLLFPLNWRWRFHSPVSYWDPAHYGREWAAFEHLLDLGLLLYLAGRYRRPARAWLHTRRQAKKTIG